MSKIVINDDLRTMAIPSDISILGVESDDDVNKIPFQMPKEYCGFDLSTFEARINYMNANGEGDLYIVQDLAEDGDDPSMMNFTWLVGRNACAYKGNVQFIVCLKKFDSNQNVIQEFNTTVYSLPVLQGLETTEAVVQQNPDIIEYILNLMDQSGIVDPTNYYTKAETNALIPTALPNPESLVINGTEYDGSEPVEITIEATSEVLASASGKLLHVVDAVPQAVQSLTLFDANGDEISNATLAITNKNLFRIDLLPASVVSKGITFTKNADGSITANGTSTGTYAMTSCNLDKNMFVVGNTYTVSTSKASGYTYIQLMITYTDNSVDYIVSRNSARSFTIAKAVASCVASVQLTDSGVTVNNEVVYPMLELADSASSYVMNTYQSMEFNGSTMPVLPASISNIWSNTDTVDNMMMQYEADTVVKKIDEYANLNLKSSNAEAHEHAGEDITSGTISADRLSTIPLTKGGTGGTSASVARANLGIGSVLLLGEKFDYNSAQVTFSEAMKYTLLSFLGRCDSSGRNVSMIIPTANITSTAVRYELTSQAGYFSVTLKASGNDIIMTYESTGDTTNGRITRVYGII